jgi:hypothetical protein
LVYYFYYCYFKTEKRDLIYDWYCVAFNWKD